MRVSVRMNVCLETTGWLCYFFLHDAYLKQSVVSFVETRILTCLQDIWASKKAYPFYDYVFFLLDLCVTPKTARKLNLKPKVCDHFLFGMQIFAVAFLFLPPLLFGGFSLFSKLVFFGSLLVRKF